MNCAHRIKETDLNLRLDSLKTENVVEIALKPETWAIYKPAARNRRFSSIVCCYLKIPSFRSREDSKLSFARRIKDT